MVKVTILYPDQNGTHFDFTYYSEVHMPRSVQLLGTHSGYRGVSVERGLSGTDPGSLPAFVALCHFEFTSVDAFLEAFMPHAVELQEDMANYTDIEPVIQFNEVLISESGAGVGQPGESWRTPQVQ